MGARFGRRWCRRAREDISRGLLNERRWQALDTVELGAPRTAPPPSYRAPGSRRPSFAKRYEPLLYLLPNARVNIDEPADNWHVAGRTAIDLPAGPDPQSTAREPH
jgi:hypothetical protein